MKRLNKKALFDDIRRRLFDNELTQSQVDGVEFIIDNWEGSDSRHLAYMLATVFHETDRTMLPIREYGGDEYFNKRYGPQTRVGKKLGNVEEGDGALFCGRGYVQITGRDNYARFSELLGVDLIVNPDKALEKEIALRIMFEGMEKGLFTGVGLNKYFNATTDDWLNARRIINGTDRAMMIASYGQKFFDALKGV